VRNLQRRFRRQPDRRRHRRAYPQRSGRNQRTRGFPVQSLAWARPPSERSRWGPAGLPSDTTLRPVETATRPFRPTASSWP